MEAIFGIIGVIVVVAVIRIILGLVIGAAGSAIKATAKTITQGGSLSENFLNQYRTMGDFELRLNLKKINLDDRVIDSYEVQVKGNINAQYESEIIFVTSLFDFTNQKHEPILSSLDFFQERTTEAYQKVIEAGKIKPNQGYMDWVTVSNFIPETLIGERSGLRIVKVLVRVMPPGELPSIELGLQDKNSTIFNVASSNLNLYLTEKGYVEFSEQRDRAKVLSVNLAVSFAMMDGDLTADEGKVIQGWIKSQVSSKRGDESQKLKELLNDALKTSYANVSSARFDRESTLDELKKLGLASSNKSLIELLVKVAGADADISNAEISLIKSIGVKLDVDYEEIRDMADKAFLEMDVKPEDSALEALLGIDSSWTPDQIRQHLRKLFTTWNSRIQTLSDSSEKEKAQQMLDAIAAARKKYGNN